MSTVTPKLNLEDLPTQESIVTPSGSYSPDSLALNLDDENENNNSATTAASASGRAAGRSSSPFKRRSAFALDEQSRMLQQTPRPGYDNEQDQAFASRRLLPSLAALLMVPFLCANYYASTLSPGGATISDHIFTVVHGVFCATVLAVVSALLPGEALIFAMWLLGFINELYGLGMNRQNQPVVNILIEYQGVFWVLFALCLGAVSGTLCKVKDMVDGRVRRGSSSSYTERLFLLIPYTLGVWAAHIVLNGQEGLFRVFASIFFSLAVVGFGVLGLKVMASFGLDQQTGGDLLSFFRVVANASFGKVLVFGLTFSVFFLYLAVPTFLTIAKLMPHSLLASIGIIIEVAVYPCVR